jgi:hypothetical protein
MAVFIVGLGVVGMVLIFAFWEFLLPFVFFY